MKGGVDVEAGIEEKKVLLVLDELQVCGSGELEGVAAMGFEIKDVVCAFGESELISTLAAVECVVALAAVEGVVPESAAEGVVAVVSA